MGLTNKTILITGAAGMIGRKLAERLRSDGSVGDQPLDAVDLVDIVPTPQFAAFEERIVADLVEADTAEELVGREPDLVFHLTIGSTHFGSSVTDTAFDLLR